MLKISWWRRNRYEKTNRLIFLASPSIRKVIPIYLKFCTDVHKIPLVKSVSGKFPIQNGFWLLSNRYCSRFGGKWKIEKILLKNQWRTKVFRTRYFSQTYYLIIGSIKTKNCNCLCVLELKIHEKDPFVCGIWHKFIYYSKYNLLIKITLK